MLLGDRSFVDSEVVTAFQKTAAYHVLVVAGLHVGALVVFFLLGLPQAAVHDFASRACSRVIALAAYVGVVQDRPPIFRAALMAALYLCARPLFRRIELLEYGRACGAGDSLLETVVARGFEFRAVVRRRRSDRRPCGAVDGAHERAVSSGVAPSRRRDARRAASAKSRAVPHRLARRHRPRCIAICRSGSRLAQASS